MSTKTNREKPPFKQLDLSFNPKSLLSDLATIQKNEWVAHVNQRAYNGSWDVYPLRCDAQYIDALPILQSFAIETAEEWKNLPILKQCPTFLSIFNTLSAQGCEIYSMRLMRLHAGSEINEHRDHGVNLDNGEVRLHVPITTNPKVKFLVNGKQAPMQAGELWYIDADLPHSVANRGDSDRIHLVIDCAVNKWLSEELCQRSCS